jgi:phosphoenolpyruvate carboxylase
MGLPAEFLGMKALTKLNEAQWRLLQKHYVKMEHDLNSIGQYVSWENLKMLMEMSGKVAKRANMNEEKLRAALLNSLEDLKTVEEKFAIKLGPKDSAQRKHENFTNNFLISMIEHEDEEAKRALVEAAKMRKCLG